MFALTSLPPPLLFFPAPVWITRFPANLIKLQSLVVLPVVLMSPLIFFLFSFLLKLQKSALIQFRAQIPLISLLFIPILACEGVFQGVQEGFFMQSIWRDFSFSFFFLRFLGNASRTNWPTVFTVRPRKRILTGVTDRGSEFTGVMKWHGLYQSVSHFCRAGGP